MGQANVERRREKAKTHMATGNEPTPDQGGASSADPIDRIQAYLDAQGGDGNQTQDDGGESQTEPASAKPTDKPDDGDHGDSNEPQFTTSHLAQFLGIDEESIDVDEDGEPVFKTKVDGKEAKAKFKDFLKDYQKQGAADNRMREAAEKEKAAERRLQEAEQAVQAKLTEQQEALKQVAQLAIVMHHDLLAEKQSINWPELWQQDARAAKALEMRFQEREGRIGQAVNTIRQRDAQLKQQAEAKQRELGEASERAQAKRLFELVPEWKDPAVFSKERSELLQWIEKSGVDVSDIDLNKASQVYLLRKSWQQDTLQASKPEIEKKLRTAPKLTKPGTPTNTNVQDVTVKGLTAEFKKSGGKDNKALHALLLAKGLA